MVRTQEITTIPAYQGQPFVKKSVTSVPKSENFLHWYSDWYPATKVTMAPIKEMAKVTHVCLYETLILLLSHDMQHFEVDSLVRAAGPNVQVPKHGVSINAG